MESPLPLSSLGLLVPPLRLRSAVMWQVVRQRNIKHYGRLEEFVSMVTEAVPELLSERERRLLSLGLRARMTLELLRSEHPEDLDTVKTHLDRIQSSCTEESNDAVIEAPEANFMRLVQSLLDDTEGREHFLKNVFPVEYGPDFDSALQTLVCEFLSRLEELLPVPDFKQTASWISEAPSVLEECMQTVSDEDDLKFLLQNKQCHGKLAKNAPFQPEDHLLTSLSFPASLKMANASHQITCDQEMNAAPQSVLLEEDPSASSEVPTTSVECQTTFKAEPTEPDRHLQRVVHKCPQCVKSFKYRYELLEHLRFHTGERPYKCSQCIKSFRTATELSGHRRRKCKNAAYLCIKCGSSFGSTLEKFRHQCTQRVRRYNCSTCGKSFGKLLLLKEHQLTHTQDRCFKCGYCGEGFLAIGDLRYHQRMDHEKPFQCNQCGKCFISTKSLAKHEQRHLQALPDGESPTLQAHDSDEGTGVLTIVTKEGKQKRRMSASQTVMLDDASSPSSQIPSTSTESPTSFKTNLVISLRPRQRASHNCPQCGRCFRYRYEFLEHQRFHTGGKPYKCSQCGKAFRRETDLSGHRRRKCKNAAYICTKCGSSFRSQRERARHQCSEQTQRFDCSHCGKSFKKSHLLRNHQLKSHQLTHTQDHRFKCRYCGEGFPGLSELRIHQRIHHEKPYECSQCGKCFISPKCLMNHELRHNQEKSELCRRCGKGFKNKYDLKLHMRTHTGERPYQCTYCSKCFTSSGSLNNHIRIHTGEKPYFCTVCGKAFNQAGALQSHIRTHTGEKPFKCTLCTKAFTTASKVTLHMRVHTGERPYTCTQCGKGFSDGSVLKKHVLNHSGVRPYHCHVCSKTYTCLNHLKRHLKTHS